MRSKSGFLLCEKDTVGSQEPGLRAARDAPCGSATSPDPAGHPSNGGVSLLNQLLKRNADKGRAPLCYCPPGPSFRGSPRFGGSRVVHKAFVVPPRPERAAESWADNLRASFLTLIAPAVLSLALSSHNAQPHPTTCQLCARGSPGRFLERGSLRPGDTDLYGEDAVRGLCSWNRQSLDTQAPPLCEFQGCVPGQKEAGVE